MKKVMIGILILIPILILVIVVAVSNLLQIAAWIAVDDITVVDNATGLEAEKITVEFSGDETTRSFTDYVKVKVFPEYANRYSVEWRISGEIVCTDETYKKEYDRYLAELEVRDRYLSDVKQIEDKISAIVAETAVAERDFETKIINVDQDQSLSAYEKEEQKALIREQFDAEQAVRDSKINELNAQKSALGSEPEVRHVNAPACLVDDDGSEVVSNTTGKFKIYSYCMFTVVVQVESISKTLTVTVEGYNVESISIANVGEDDNKLVVGEKMLVEAKYNPISSIVTKTEWQSSNPAVASVDANGIITAHSAGTADITVKANRYDDKNIFVTSAPYTVEVKEGVSKFGEAFSTSELSFTLEQAGISDGVTSFDGCEIYNGTVTMTGDTAQITTSRGTVTVTRCAADDISIENADIYSSQNGYVFAVSELPLKLRAVWTDALKEGAPDNVSWEAESDDNIVSVENGVVTAKGSGFAMIRARRGGKSASVLLNVQIKLVSMNLRTSNDSLKVGLALETVFAAEKYANSDKDDNTKVANSTLIQIIGAPKRTDTDTDASFAAKLGLFYSSYNYEVAEGAEFARFSDSADEPNRLIFNASALNGRDRQVIKVKVSAKYPRYESSANLTTDTVDIAVVYGVEVENIAQLRKASDDQKAYATSLDNLVPRELGFEHINYSEGRADKYRYYIAEHSKHNYSIVFANDIAFELDGYENYKEDGQTKSRPIPQIDSGNNVKFFGNVYGNGHRLECETDQMVRWEAMTHIVWSNVTVSNLNFRANKMEKDGTLSADETNGLGGECVNVQAYEDIDKVRISGIKVEFCIMENARRAGQTKNADCTFDGVVIRNISNTAFYIPARMKTYDEEDGLVTYPVFSGTYFNNCVFSNCISSIGSYPFERFTVVEKTGSANPYPNCSAGDGRFIRKDPAANAEYFREHFLSKGITNTIVQTGFLDIYNWQNVNNANLIDTGDANTNKMIGTLAGRLIKENPEFEKCRYLREEDNSLYFHMGFLSSGVSFGEGIMDEPIYLDITFEDERFVKEPIRTRNVKTTSADLAAAELLISKMELVFYGYNDKSDITPTSTFIIDSRFIEHLHGLK